MSAAAYLRLARPVDWLKNGFVPVGVLFAQDWQQHRVLLDVGIVTIAFCLAASGVYAVNDAADADADAAHPAKRSRPVAAGAVSPVRARWFGLACAVAGTALAASVSLAAAAIVAAYLVLNLAYTHGLKRIPFVDVMAIAGGFMLRIFAGTVGVGIPPSRWLVVTALALTLFLGFAKRRAELVGANGDTQVRAALRGYGLHELNVMVLTSALMTAAFYLGFSFDPQTASAHGTSYLWLTAPLVLAAIGRYVFLVFRRKAGEDPARVLAGDLPLAAAALAWLLATVLLLALRP